MFTLAHLNNFFSYYLSLSLSLSLSQEDSQMGLFVVQGLEQIQVR